MPKTVTTLCKRCGTPILEPRTLCDVCRQTQAILFTLLGHVEMMQDKIEQIKNTLAALGNEY